MSALKHKTFLEKAELILTIAVVIFVLGSAIWIMARRIGLVDGLDFGAGAYYYADIPDFDKYTTAYYATSIPYWVYVLLFLAWGFLMFEHWKWIDRRGGRKDGKT